MAIRGHAESLMKDLPNLMRTVSLSGEQGRIERDGEILTVAVGRKSESVDGHPLSVPNDRNW